MKWSCIWTTSRRVKTSERNYNLQVTPGTIISDGVRVCMIIEAKATMGRDDRLLNVAVRAIHDGSDPDQFESGLGPGEPPEPQIEIDVETGREALAIAQCKIRVLR